VGNISRAEEQPEFISLKEANSELSKKNKYHHHLGTGGYKHQVSKWRQEDAKKKAVGLPTLSEQFGERTANWIRARKPRETKASVSFDNPNVEEAAKNIYAMVAKQSQVIFKPQRERDILTAGLSNPEHTGRVRGISSKDLDHSGKVCIRNVIDTKKSCRIIFSRRQRKSSKT
jgi:hypothetical protein